MVYVKIVDASCTSSQRIQFKATCSLDYRLRVVPHFSSEIVERAKRERAWKSPHARKGDTWRGERMDVLNWFGRGYELHTPKSVGRERSKAWALSLVLIFLCRLFSRGVIFTRTRVSHALLSKRKNRGLLVVYLDYEQSLFSSSIERNVRDTQMTTRVTEGGRGSTLSRACTPLAKS